jgi:putative hemolysin
MKMSLIRYILTLVCPALMLVSACASQSPVPENMPAEQESLPGMPNPSAVYCEGLGYVTETVTRAGGEDADCIFPDGTHCPAWDFLAGRCGAEYSYCAQQGFTLEVENNIGICRFPDGSYCDEYQYFNGECAPGDSPAEVQEEGVQLVDAKAARDYLAAYFQDQYGIAVSEPWIAQDITPIDAVGSSTTRFVAGPVTIVISAPASAPSPTLYTVEEAADISNGFFWQGTLGFDGKLTHEKVNPPGTVLRPEDARDAIMQHITVTYDLPGYGDWSAQDLAPTDADTVVGVYTSGHWFVAVEFAPAAPLVGSYHVTANHLQEEIRWEGEITLQGDITETSFSK